MKINKEEFLKAYLANTGATQTELAEIISKEYSIEITQQAVGKRIRKYIANGEIDLEAGVSVQEGTVLTGISRYHKLEDGGIWVKSNVEKENQLKAMNDAVDNICEKVRGMYVPRDIPEPGDEQTMNLYISNDLHFGALMAEKETGDRNWDLKIAEKTTKESIDYLVENSPATKTALVADLGDLLEMDSFSNMTPKSGNILDVDGRWSKVLEVAQETIIYMVEAALRKHEKVYFLNIAGNHDLTSGYAIQSFVKAWFKDEPRVIVNKSHRNIKYFRFDKTLLGFAHGDEMKMNQASETMVVDNEDIFSETIDRFFHFGHNHKDSVIDTKICRIESHRNLSPLNVWAANHGFRRQVGTMKAITYHRNLGEINRATFNVRMTSDE